MSKQKPEKTLSEEERKAIFRALVQAQDEMSVVKSRKEIAEQFGISDRQIRRIEQEGLDAVWPPLE